MTAYRIDHERVAHETLDGEVVILDQVSGTYFSLTGTGPEVWELIARGLDDAALVAALEARFEAPAGSIGADVATLCAELVREELLARVAAVAGAADVNGAADATVATVTVAANAGGARKAWSAPKLERFTDLQSLLLLDPIHDVDLDGAGWPRQQTDKA